MAQQITLRKGTAAQWSLANPTLAAGEPGVETDTGKFKIGNGSQLWSALPYTVGTIPTDISELTDTTNIIPSGLLIDDPNPSLGQDLTLNGRNIGGTGNISLDGYISISGNLDSQGLSWAPTANLLKVGTTNAPSAGGTDGRVEITTNTAFITTQPMLSMRQHHETSDANRFTFIRSRGTRLVPLAVQNNDNIINLVFQGYKGPSYSTACVISATVDGALGAGVPGKLQFFTNNGTTLSEKATLTNDGKWKVDTVESITTDGNLSLAANGTGIIQVGASIIPTTDITYDLGSLTNRFKDLFLSGSTIKLGDATISAAGTNVSLPAGSTVGGINVGTIILKGSVADTTARDAIVGAVLGDAYIVQTPLPATLHTWDGVAWVNLGAFQGPAGANGADGADGADGINGADGADGADGINGADGADGVGVPIGGTTGQVLIKVDGTDYNTTWGTASTVAALDDLTDVTITTPSNGQILKYNGSSWVNDTDNAAAIFSRSSVSATTASLADGVSGNVSITGFKSYVLLKLQTSAASWVRLYTDNASRSADASRAEGVDPAAGAGVIAEVITTGAQTILISPGTIGFNNETSPTTSIPVSVTNKSGTTTTITVTLTIIQLEA